MSAPPRCADGCHFFGETVVCECSKQASAPQRAESREGMVMVYDYYGQYVGCMGRELWTALVNAKEAAGRAMEIANTDSDSSGERYHPDAAPLICPVCHGERLDGQEHGDLICNQPEGWVPGTTGEAPPQ